MNEGQTFDRHEDEIDLKELIMVLWKGKNLIIIVTLIFAMLSALVTMFLIPPVYEAELDLMVNFPETVSTKYGDYKLLMTTNDQYINLFYANSVINNTILDMGYDIENNSIESFSKRISIIKDKERPNSFTVKVKSNNPKEALDLVNTLYKNYILLLNTNTKLRSAEQFIETHTTELSKLKDNLNSNEVLLDQYKKQLETMSQTINQNSLLDTIESSNINYMVLENIINQNYKKVELDIINTEQTIYSLENKVNVLNQYLNELNQIKDDIINNKGLVDEYLSSINRSIQVSSEPVAPSSKSSPSTTMYTLIAAVIGGMLSVMYVLIRNYWFNDVKAKG
jgi:uncharacterized protein involved in exopolysaccharide biosynthesis